MSSTERPRESVAATMVVVRGQDGFTRRVAVPGISASTVAPPVSLWQSLNLGGHFVGLFLVFSYIQYT